MDTRQGNRNQGSGYNSNGQQSGRQNNQQKVEMVTIEGSQISVPAALQAITQNLKADLEAKKEALPKGFSRDRFILNTSAMLKAQLRDYETAKKFAIISYTSIISCFEQAAFLGLDFFNGECYAIPYGKSLQFQTDYKGEIKLCKAYSTNPIRDIFAKVVRQGDEYLEEVIDGDQTITFKPIPFNNGEIIGAFAIVKFKDGSMAYDSMSREEIEHIRNSYSKAAKSPAWEKSYGEMCKKTVLRRLSKTIDKNFNADQLRAYEDGGDAIFENSSSGSTRTAEVVDSTASDITDAYNAAKQKTESEPKQIQNPEQTPAHQAFQRQRQQDPVQADQSSDDGRQAQYDEWAQYEQMAGQGSGDPDAMPFR